MLNALINPPSIALDPFSYFKMRYIISHLDKTPGKTMFSGIGIKLKS
jgi:hypothetical protein